MVLVVCVEEPSSSVASCTRPLHTKDRDWRTSTWPSFAVREAEQGLFAMLIPGTSWPLEMRPARRRSPHPVVPWVACSREKTDKVFQQDWARPA